MIGASQADFLLFDLERVRSRAARRSSAGPQPTAGSSTTTARPTSTGRRQGFADDGREPPGAHRRCGASRSATRSPRSIATDYNQGYVRNINEERLFDKGGTSDFMAGRLQFLFEPSDTFSLNIKGEYGESGPVSNERSCRPA
jgi:hypothetical protein